LSRVAFIGLGRMGSHMCRHVCEAGHEVTAFDLNPAAVDAASAHGARPASSLAACVSGAEILVTSLPGPPQVEAVLSEALPAMAPDSLAIEMSTSSLEVGRRMAELAVSREIELLDAPVAGQTIGAEAGTLAIYVGGSSDAFSRALPVLAAIGPRDRIFHLGPAGSGYAVKLVLNMMWFVHLVATAEALTIGVKAGVSLDRLHEALVKSPANSVFLERDVRIVLDDGDYDEGFFMSLVTKDLGLAVDLARDVGVPVEIAPVVERLHRRAREVYGDSAGEMSGLRLYEDAAGVELRLSRGVNTQGRNALHE
jgi:3-hydroxyisobutyrate dehydrogenase